MAIRVALNHVSHYTFDRPVTLTPHVVRLRPAPHSRTPIHSYSLKVTPPEHFLNWQQDAYSNYQARLVFNKPATELRIEVDLVAELTSINPFDFFIEDTAQEYPFAYEPVLARELAPYLELTDTGWHFLDLVESLRRKNLRTLDYIVEINRRVNQLVHYVIRLEPGLQTCEQTLTKKSGSCRDSAWLLVQVFRRLGLAARFVSGYSIQLTADQKALDGPSGVEFDVTDLHAWAEVYLPGAGWIGLDATSGLLCGEGHIPLACAAEPTNAAPITGGFLFDPRFEGDKVKDGFTHSMKVTRVLETPRVTKPYSEAQWTAIDAMGDRVDRDLKEWDVRLTMGGEPTFVSIDDRDAEEWNTAALGPNKLRQGNLLLKRLRERWAPTGFLHHGQGKWYPGESLPRWAYGCYWRKDGVPVWEDRNLIGDPEANYGYGPADAERFVKMLAEKLGVRTEHCQPGYEDAWYYMWRERRLPTNVDPLESKLDEKEERERLAKVFDQGLKHVVGYALPIRKRAERWESGALTLRREHLFLIPGDSPMGYRLPLDSLAWEPESVRDLPLPLDPSAPKPPLPPKRKQTLQSRLQPYFHTDGPYVDPSYRGEFGPGGSFAGNGVAGPGEPYAKPKLSEGAVFNAEWYMYPVMRTALCVEARDGRLHIFLPPAKCLEDYLELVAAIEATASEVKQPVLIEGYKPPHDHRLDHFAVTPDPGVIEVNTSPSANWRELEDKTTALYDEARLCRLAADKFMLDGRHTGTGGGNHMILGGATPIESPILRRPDLLRSLVGFWHNHPSLSYLFSTMFIGPTSQAPRVDEARNDSVYELEIAFRQVPEGAGLPPWLTDRIFRNLLVDLTGNTHRAEFCIDKLYSPDGFDGRRGLLELRAFEMPPHSRMSLVQQLFLRTLVADFWRKPYKRKLARWGTELHDKFLLPHFVEQDLDDVLKELSNDGYALPREWFAPHVEFRFPTIGTVSQQGIHIELRFAIEPWHVLGEESAAGGTARYVDSSVERVQVKLQGLTDARHVLTCNGRRVPLHPTGVNGEFVAGVRYRAWQPPSCLHPTIPVHTPLVFDLYDTWTGRSIGGCQYHVAHPGGRGYDTFPVNSNEAEGRRTSRFFAFGHSAGPRLLPPAEVTAERPLTLDLRLVPPRLPMVPVEKEAALGVEDRVAVLR